VIQCIRHAQVQTFENNCTPWLAVQQPVSQYVAYLTDCQSARPRTSRPTVHRTSRRTAGADAAPSCRQNISTYAPI